MRNAFPIFILALFLIGIAAMPGCDSGFNVSFDDVKETLFNTAINWALVTISEELGGDNAADRIDWITATIEENLGDDILSYADKFGLDWENVIEKAYYLVFNEGTKLLEAKLTTPEYEGADPVMYLVLEPSDFSEWREDILAN